MTCKYYDKCYFPKDVKKALDRFNPLTNENNKRYWESCNNEGLECELSKLSEIEFKIFERFE